MLPVHIRALMLAAYAMLVQLGRQNTVKYNRPCCRNGGTFESLCCRQKNVVSGKDQVIPALFFLLTDHQAMKA